MSKHLFTIAALVLPISLIPVTQENFLLDNNYAKTFLVLAWFSFLISLISGLIHLSKEVTFFNNWAEQETSKSKEFTNPIRTTNESTAYDVVSEMYDKADDLDKLPKIMPQTFLRWQQFSLVAGILFIGGVLLVKLFF